MIGVNLAGAEFATNYVYPQAAEIDYFQAKGLGLIRIPFKWERLQPTPNGPLDETELAKLQAAVDYATAKGMTVVLDVHNFGKGYGATIGSVGTPDATFANLWTHLASVFKDDPNVIFGLMNEPNSQTASQWIVSANAAIDAIRATGATQQILVPGAYHSGAHDWVSSDNDTVVGEGVVDPLNNYAFEVHQYLDANNSGTSRSVVSETIGVTRLTAITQWAIDHGQKLFLGEFGVSNDPTAVVAMDRMLQYMEQNASVWTGATYWAAGSGWGDYMFSIQPDDLANPVDKVQLDVLEKYDLRPETPVPAISPPPPLPDGVTIARAPDAPSVINEGDTMQLAFTVRNAVAGQSFDFWQQSTMDADDFVRSLAQDFAAILPPGASYTEITALRGTITLAPGTYSFILNRETKLDGVVETIDKASWAEGNQENTDIRIGNAQGGLKIVSDTDITNWVTDRAAAEPAAPPPGAGAIVGTGAADALNGTAGDDAIYGLAGNDSINGLGGNDRLIGGSGNDRLDGGAGRDEMWGEGGNDIYFIDDAGDLVHEAFGGGTDTVNSTISYRLGDNVEHLVLRTGARIDGTGNALNNRIEGNSGANMLVGGAGDDTLLGYGGNDIVVGGIGRDVLNGGAGADIFLFDVANDGSIDQVQDFAAGTDKVGVDATAFGLRYGAGIGSDGRLAAGWFVPTGSATTATHGQFLYDADSRTLLWDADGQGSAQPTAIATFNPGVSLTAGDILVMGAGEPPSADTSPPTASGGAADISVAAGTHQAVVTYSDGGSGVDATTIGTDDLTISGPGNVTVQSVSTVTNTDGSVIATYMLASPGGFTAQDNGSHAIALVAGSVQDLAGNGIAAASPLDLFTIAVAPPANDITGTQGDDTLNGTSGVDVIRGLEGNDTLNGLAGDDMIEGGAGNDKINGNAGADSMRGGTGNDVYFVDDAGDRVIELANEGTDSVNSDIGFTLPDHVENLILRTAVNSNGTGNGLNNRIEGNSGANSLSGLDGNDVLVGKGGSDILTGGAGSDIFLFDTAPGAGNIDRITDFTPGVDRIHLENAIFTGLPVTGTLAAAAFHSGSSAASAATRIIHDSATGALFYDADGSGAGLQVQFASVTPGLPLGYADFVAV